MPSLGLGAGLSGGGVVPEPAPLESAVLFNVDNAFNVTHFIAFAGSVGNYSGVDGATIVSSGTYGGVNLSGVVQFTSDGTEASTLTCFLPKSLLTGGASVLNQYWAAKDEGGDWKISVTLGAGTGNTDTGNNARIKRGIGTGLFNSGVIMSANTFVSASTTLAVADAGDPSTQDDFIRFGMTDPTAGEPLNNDTFILKSLRFEYIAA